MVNAIGNALLLNAEISNVVTVMRQAPKWSLIPRQYSDEEDGDEPLLDDFKLLRRKVFTWEDWSSVEPLEYLEPFLEVIRSPEVSGPVTGVALAGLNRMLSKYIFGDSDKGAAEAMQAIADAVTECKYESADAASDEVVLFKILQVLLSCVKCPGGLLLTDDNIKAIFEACYRIGQLQADGGKSLLDAAQQTMHEVVVTIFSRVDLLAVDESSSWHDPDATPLKPGTKVLHELHQTPPPSVPHSPPPPAAPPAEDAAVPAAAAAEPVAAGEAVADSEAQPGVGADAEPGATDAAAPAALPEPPRSSFATSNGIVSVAAPHDDGEEKPDLLGREGEGKGADEGSKPKTKDGYGLACITTIFEYIISWVASDKEDEVVFGLDLAVAALNAGGQGLEKHAVLLGLVVEHMCQALFDAMRFNNLTALSGVCQASLSLYMHLGSHLLLQLEAIIGNGLLKIAEGKGRVDSLDLQEAALEGLLDFVNQPQFLQDCYINLDCHIERSNLFENICALLSKTAFPVNSPLGSLHLLSLDGLFAILSALANKCNRATNNELPLHSYDDPVQFIELWSALCNGQQPPITNGMQVPGGGTASWVDIVRMEKYLKGRLAVAADHFNRDHKKGFQFLQALNLLPAKGLDPVAVAMFLRVCPGLSKTTVGELLGEADDFYLDVLEAFTNTFDFTGMRIDTALRTYLETFRLPGEAQKINRIMESFGKQYHEQSPGTFKNSDAVYILAYSVIMLNTDLHNEQVKQKMTVEEFIRNNRGINNGKDLPGNLLRSLYENIRKSEIKIYNDVESNEVSPVFWTELVIKSQQPRGLMLRPDASANTNGLERDMFSLIWGPMLAAVSVVMDHSSDMVIVQQALEGVKLAAKMASYHQTDQVMDSLVVALSKFTMLLNPAVPKPTVAFGEDGKARMSMEAIFYTANTYGDSLHSGWKNVMDIVMRLFKLGLLPAAAFALEGEDVEALRPRLPRYSPAKRSGSTGSLLSRAISSLISIEDREQQLEQPSTREVNATQRTLACIEACHIHQLFADSKFLLEGSLVELANAIHSYAGTLPPPVVKGNNSHAEELSCAEMCLELLLALALCNRDRLPLVWPRVHDLLAVIMDEGSFKLNNSLLERAVFGLLRVCQRLLPYKEDGAEALMQSMKLICGLHSSVIWDLAEPLSAELLSLVKSSATYIHTPDGWETVCMLLVTTSIHPRATANSFEALRSVCSTPQLLSEVNFVPCLEALLRFVDQYSKNVGVEQGLEALHMVDSLFDWLQRWACEEGGISPSAVAATGQPNFSNDSKAERVQAYWWMVVDALCKYGHGENAALRNSAIEMLKRLLTASESLNFGPTMWVKAVEEGVAPMAGELAGYVSSKARSHPDADKSLRLAVATLTKTVLHYLPQLLQDSRFPDVWSKVLIVLQSCTRNASEELAEAVPEAVKNMLLVMAAKEILVPDWVDEHGHNLWDMTWSKAKTISSGLTPLLLTTSGIPGFEAPEPPSPPAEVPASPLADAVEAASPSAAGAAEAAGADYSGSPQQQQQLAAADMHAAYAGEAAASSSRVAEDEASRRDVLMVHDTTDGSVSVTSYTYQDDAEPAVADASAPLPADASAMLGSQQDADAYLPTAYDAAAAAHDLPIEAAAAAAAFPIEAAGGESSVVVAADGMDDVAVAAEEPVGEAGVNEAAAEGGVAEAAGQATEQPPGGAEAGADGDIAVAAEGQEEEEYEEEAQSKQAAGCKQS